MRFLVTTASMLVLLVATAAAQNWPHWRGPARNGVSQEAGLPVSWGAKCKTASLDSEPLSGSGSIPARVTQRGRGASAGLVVSARAGL